METEELRILVYKVPCIGLNAGVKEGLYKCPPSLHIPAASIDRKIYPITEEQYEFVCNLFRNRS